MTKRQIEALACGALYGNVYRKLEDAKFGDVAGGSVIRMVDQLKREGLVDQGNEPTRRGLERLRDRLDDVPEQYRHAASIALEQKLAAMPEEPSPSRELSRLVGKTADFVSVGDPAGPSDEPAPVYGFAPMVFPPSDDGLSKPGGERIRELEPAPALRYEFYRGRRLFGRTQWRWRAVVNQNDEIIASGEGYNNLVDAVHAVELLRGSSNAAMLYIGPPFD